MEKKTTQKESEGIISRDSTGPVPVPSRVGNLIIYGKSGKILVSVARKKNSLRLNTAPILHKKALKASPKTIELLPSNQTVSERTRSRIFSGTKIKQVKINNTWHTINHYQIY